MKLETKDQPCCHSGIAHDCHAGENCKVVQRIKAALDRENQPLAYINQHGVVHEADYEWGPNNILTALYARR
jgi:hypothetical protein